MLSMYRNAVAELSRSERNEAECIRKRTQCRNDLSNEKTKKKNKEKRREDVIKLIQMLDGSGGWFSTDVPEDISNSRKALTELDGSFRSSIVISGADSASMASNFQVKTVTGDSNSNASLNSFRSVKNELDGEISDCQTRIRKLENSIDDLDRQIRNHNTYQSQLRREKVYYLAQMEYWG